MQGVARTGQSVFFSRTSSPAMWSVGVGDKNGGQGFRRQPQGFQRRGNPAAGDAGVNEKMDAAAGKQGGVAGGAAGKGMYGGQENNLSSWNGISGKSGNAACRDASWPGKVLQKSPPGNGPVKAGTFPDGREVQLICAAARVSSSGSSTARISAPKARSLPIMSS